MTKNEERLSKLFKELVPDMGKAESLAGELVRAINRIGYRFCNDGDMVNGRPLGTLQRGRIRKGAGHP